MNVLIVGGGRIGRELMERIPSSRVVESDDGRHRALVDRFGADRVTKGNGVDESTLLAAGMDNDTTLVVATNDDQTNHLVALVAQRAGVRRIIARVECPENIRMFERLGINSIICPTVSAANMIDGEIVRESSRVFEIPIFDDSYLNGRAIRDVELPEDSIVVSVVRGRQMIRPEPDMLLRRGDHVVVFSTGSLPHEVESIACRADRGHLPFKTVLAVIRCEMDLDIVLGECIPLVKRMCIGLVVTSTSEELLKEALRRASAADVYAEERMAPSLEYGMLNHLMCEQFMDMECVALSALETNKRRALRSWPLGIFLNNARVPVLLCRGSSEHSTILSVMDESIQSEQAADLAIRMAIHERSSITMLAYREDGIVDTEVERIRRLGRLYDVRIEEVRVEGNPTIDFVCEARSGKYDLTVVNWRSRSIKKDLLRRVMIEGPNSVLIHTGMREKAEENY